MTECPTCGSEDPRFHPAVSGGGEVTELCHDDFHKPLQPTRDTNNQLGQGGPIQERRDF